MAQLKESNEKFIAIGVSAQDAIIMMDDEGNISFWNEAAERTFGYSRKEAVGSRVSELIIPRRYRLAHIEGLKKFREAGKGTVLGNIIELKAIRKDNPKNSPIELSLSALKLKERWCPDGCNTGQQQACQEGRGAAIVLQDGISWAINCRDFS